MEQPDATPPPTDGELSFSGLGLDDRILRALDNQGFDKPTPIQHAAIPQLLGGADVIGRARTGSGKTAAFAIPALERIKDGRKGARVLVLAPTRELALQVTDAMRDLSKGLPVRVACIYGGASYTPQLQALRSGAQVIVATPGRLLDHLERGSLDLSGIEVLVLDEADEMLRMGFIDDVERVFEETPDSRQVCLFSATMPDEIKRVADAHCPEAVEVQVESSGLSVGHIDQRWILVPFRRKVDTLVRLLGSEDRGTTLVFARTRKSCAETADLLAKRGVAADALHGDLNQAARERVLHRMRSGRLDVVIATDVAARGIDVQHITHVVNFDLPLDVEIYVHRIGRTGRAGRAGNAISFVTRAERRRIHQFQRVLKVPIVNVEPPTDRDVAVQQRESLKRRMNQALANDLTDVTAWIEELRQDGWTDSDIAAASLHLISRLEGHDLRPVPKKREVPARDNSDFDESDHGERPRRQRDRKPRPEFDRGENTNEVELFLATGRKFGVRPGDLVGALANECGIAGERIGRVTIVEKKSFVGLPKEVAEALLDERQTLEIRGHEVHIAMARGRPEGAHRGHEDRRPQWGGDRDRRGGGRSGFKPRGRGKPNWRR